MGKAFASLLVTTRMIELDDPKIVGLVEEYPTFATNMFLWQSREYKKCVLWPQSNSRRKISFLFQDLSGSLRVSSQSTTHQE